MKWLLPILLISNLSMAADPEVLPKYGTPEENAWAAEQNLHRDLEYNLPPFKVVRPVEDFGNF